MNDKIIQKEPPVVTSFRSYGAFTLHGTGTRTGTGDGTRINGFLCIMFTVHTTLRQGQEPDPLSPIVLVLFPVPVPVPVPCSVNKPLDPINTERETCCLENGYGTHLQVASLAATLPVSLGVNGAVEIDVCIPSKRCH